MTTSAISDTGKPWWNLLNRYHGFVLIVTALGWLLDRLDQRLVRHAHVPSVAEVLDEPFPAWVAIRIGNTK